MIKNSIVKSRLLLKELTKKVMSSRKMLGFVAGLLCIGIAALDSFTPPEVPVEALYGLPIYLALKIFGWYPGLGITGLSICFFYISNFVIGQDSSADIWPSIILSLIFFLVFARSAYQFILNQRQLSIVQQDLETRFKEMEKLYQDSQLLHQQNLKLAVSEERNRLAREIHDVLAQGLAAIIFQVEAAFANRDKPDILEERLTQIIDLAHHNLQEARRSVANLRPLQLHETTLPDALQQKLDGWSKEASMRASFSTTGSIQPLANEVERALYRITQEALNNVSRHAGADEVQVTLDYDDEEVCLTIQDNGKGFDRDQATLVNFEDEPGSGQTPTRNKFGLKTMEERASLIGGWTIIQSKPDQGCRVRVIVPNNKALPLSFSETTYVATLPE